MVEPAGRGLPVVAVVGRPNVGKSSLVNRVLGRREAIAHERPGVTRDRRGFGAEWAGRRFELVDTGGLEPGAHGLDARVVEQAQVAIAAADVVVLVVDAVAGPSQDDHVVAEILRRSRKPVLLVANKVDDPRDESAAAAFYRLGLGDPHALSALHGRGSGDFLEALVAALPEDRGSEAEAWASIALVGRPNVGKSSILNRLVGEQRAIVDARPGTTRDPVDSFVDLPDGRRLRIVDTAGMRREVKIADPIEYFGFLRSRRTLERVDGAVLVVDAGEGVTGHDQRIAEEILEAGRACVVALNKWDLVPREDADRRRFDRDLQTKLRFVPWATIVRTAAIRGRGIDRILPAVETALRSHRNRVPTAEVNRIVQEAQAHRPHPRTRGRAVRILYAVQARTAPPHIILFASGPVSPEYLRFLEHRVRDVEPFPGTPLRLEVKQKNRRQ